MQKIAERSSEEIAEATRHENLKQVPGFWTQQNFRKETTKRKNTNPDGDRKDPNLKGRGTEPVEVRNTYSDKEVRQI
jgi:hypothetical protein